MSHSKIGVIHFSYCFKDSSKNVDLNLKCINIDLKFNLVHVGSIYILKSNKHQIVPHSSIKID